MQALIDMPGRLVLAISIGLICVSPAAAGTQLAVATDVPSIRAPPAGFDPFSASEAELDEYGFPPRPDAQAEPDAYRAWALQVEPGIRRIVPKLVPMEVAGRRPGAPPAPVKDVNWSGYVFANQLPVWSSSSFRQVRGSWNVPVAQFPFGYECAADAPESKVAVGVWVGIDGSHGADGLLQAGIAAEAICEDGDVSTDYYAWNEWYPAPPQLIANMAVGPGDIFASTVTAKSPTSGRVYLVNLTTRVSASLQMQSPEPPASDLVGRTAEWVVERPGEGNGTTAELTNYTQVVFTEASASTASKSFVPGRRPYPRARLGRYLMLDDNDEVISIPKLLGEGAIYIHNVGSSREVSDASED